MDNKSEREDYRPVKDILADFVQKNRLQQGLDKVNIEKIWKSEMGPVIEKYTTGMMLKKDTLYVSISSPELRNELSYGKGKIISILNEALQKPLIKKLVLQ